MAEIIFILDHTTHPGNIGAAARAIKTMGFNQLRLVSPGSFPDPIATARASGASDVLASAQVCSALEPALADLHYVVGCTARKRYLNWTAYTPERFAQFQLSLAEDAKVGVLFGSERAGLDNAALQHCHGILHIPSDAEYGSLNLAAAVQIVAYVLARELGCHEPIAARDTALATQAQMTSLYNIAENVLHKVDFFAHKNADHSMLRLRCLFNRLTPSQKECNFLHAVFAQMAAFVRMKP